MSVTKQVASFLPEKIKKKCVQNSSSSSFFLNVLSRKKGSGKAKSSIALKNACDSTGIFFSHFCKKTDKNLLW